MNRNQLKKLSRRDLLTLLLEQMRENEILTMELTQARQELERRELIVKEKGSLAEAAMELMEIFKRADQAAEIYLENIQKQGPSIK